MVPNSIWIHLPCPAHEYCHLLLARAWEWAFGMTAKCPGLLERCSCLWQLHKSWAGLLQIAWDLPVLHLQGFPVAKGGEEWSEILLVMLKQGRVSPCPQLNYSQSKRKRVLSHCSHNPSNSFTEQMICVSLSALDSPSGFFMDLCASQLSINADREPRLWACVFFGSQIWLLALFVKLLQLRKLWQALRGQFNFFKLDEAVAGFS